MDRRRVEQALQRGAGPLFRRLAQKGHAAEHAASARDALDKRAKLRFVVECEVGGEKRHGLKGHAVLPFRS